MRWVQETNECIASVANPVTFVLDNPQNVRVQIAQVICALLKGLQIKFMLNHALHLSIMSACFLSS